ncbi:MAG TPA: hypothetical protein DER09_03915 [Prolixibacteraceae bacterium]|nr:hypothetical protein [Prolixibacteraceae bacterium]
MKILKLTIAILIICSSCEQSDSESELYKRPDFEIKNIETDLYGKWNLIEITESESNQIYYPPVDKNSTVTFFKNSNEIEWDFNDFKFDLPFEASVVNTFMSSFLDEKDSVNISDGRQTVMFSEKSHLMQFEKLFFSTIASKRFEIQIDKNILKLSNEYADLLFYK